MGKRLRAFYVALASLIGFDVRFTRRGKVYFVLRDRREDLKIRKKMITIRRLLRSK